MGILTYRSDCVKNQKPPSSFFDERNILIFITLLEKHSEDLPWSSSLFFSHTYLILIDPSSFSTY